MTSAASSTRRHNTQRVAADDSDDENPRPTKRQRIQSTPVPDAVAYSESLLEPLTPLPSQAGSEPASRPPPSRTASQQQRDLALRPIPPAILLVSLPSLLAHPPNHRFYIHSLVLSLTALRKCLALPALSPEIECRAWTGLAEIGMRVISGGMSQSEEHVWAKGIESEVRIYLVELIDEGVLWLFDEFRWKRL